MQEHEQQQGVWRDYYALLGIAPEADSEAVKTACAALIERYHFEERDRDLIVESVKLVDEARRCLLDPKTRASYDRLYRARRRKAPNALVKSSLSQIMLVCPDCDAHHLYDFNRSTRKLSCPHCGAAFTSRAGELKTIRSNRTGFRWYYSITINGLYDGKEHQVDFDIGFKVGVSELRVGDNVVLTYLGPEFAIIQNLTTSHYWRLVRPSTRQ